MFPVCTPGFFVCLAFPSGFGLADEPRVRFACADRPVNVNHCAAF